MNKSNSPCIKKNALLIFVRNPILGKVKTRLARDIGDERALTIYLHLLKHTKKISQDLSFDKFIYYTDFINENDLWDIENFKKEKQQGGDLGERMENAFIDSFNSHYEKVVLIGSDINDLKNLHLKKAFDQLNESDIVLGPAKDGGYYLIGMKKIHPEIFKNKDWGTDSILKDTLKNLEKVNVHLLEELNDIDLLIDVKNDEVLKNLLES